MLYRMKQKIWLIGHDFTIEDAEGNAIFQVGSKGFSIGDDLSFRDMDGAELAHISQKLLTLHNTYQIFRSGKLFAAVKRNWTYFDENFVVNVPGPNDYTVSGDFFDHEYEFLRDSKIVARVSKSLFSRTDTYGINVVPGEDDVVILATAIVIELINEHRGQDEEEVDLD